MRGWTLPGEESSVVAQAAARGVAVPVGQSAERLRADGWQIRAAVADIEIIRADSTSRTGYVWWCEAEAFARAARAHYVASGALPTSAWVAECWPDGVIEGVPPETPIAAIYADADGRLVGIAFDLEDALCERLNAERAANGVPPLIIEPATEKSAAERLIVRREGATS